MQTLTRLLFPVLLTLLPLTLAYQCATPTTFTPHLPAILEVENLCSTSPVALCLEFAGSVYPIRNLPASEREVIPTVLHDCWVFRAATCSGTMLMEHSVTGSRKLSVGCTREATATYATQIATSVPLDCSLTNPPRLADVFDASVAYLPKKVSNHLDDNLFADLDEPTQHVDKEALLRSIYTTVFDLARRNVTVEPAINIFRHTRAVIWHIEECHPELVGAEIGIAQSYIGLYGAALAALHGETRARGDWIVNPPALTQQQQQAFEEKMQLAVTFPVNRQFPATLYPGVNEGVTLQSMPVSGRLLKLSSPAAHSLTNVSNAPMQYTTSATETMKLQNNETLRTSELSAALNKEKPISHTAARIASSVNLMISSIRPAQHLQGQNLCNSDSTREWTYFKMSKENHADDKVDCCEPACVRFPEISSSFSSRSFKVNCCLRCNWENLCNGEVSAATRAVMELAEIQLPTNSTTEMEEPQRVLI